MGIRSLTGFLGGVPGQILAAFGNLGSLLFEAGKNLIRGLLRGIESMISQVRAKLTELTNLLPSWKGPPERDAKLLRANGVLIMRSLMDGFEAEEPAVRRYLTELTDRIPAATLAVEAGPVAAQRLAGQAAATADRDSAPRADLVALVDAIERLGDLRLAEEIAGLVAFERREIVDERVGDICEARRVGRLSRCSSDTERKHRGQ